MLLVRALLASAAIAAVAVFGVASVNGEAAGPDVEVEQLERRVAWLEQRVARLEQERDDEARRAERARAAVEGLLTAAELLTAGVAEVGDALDAAEAALPQARWSVRAARRAIANKDLGLAREHVYQAILEARHLPMPAAVR